MGATQSIGDQAGFHYRVTREDYIAKDVFYRRTIYVKPKRSKTCAHIGDQLFIGDTLYILVAKRGNKIGVIVHSDYRPDDALPKWKHCQHLPLSVAMYKQRGCNHGPI
jgi:hypothetical protein